MNIPVETVLYMSMSPFKRQLSIPKMKTTTHIINMHKMSYRAGKSLLAELFISCILWMASYRWPEIMSWPCRHRDLDHDHDRQKDFPGPEVCIDFLGTA